MRCIADLECLRGALGVERWHVGGHSWGAALALRYAIAHRARVSSLLYLSGTDLEWRRHRIAYRAERLRRAGARLEVATGRERMLLSLSADFADREHAVSLAKQWGYWRFPINQEANAAINADTEGEDDAELRRKCAALDVKTLVIHGEQDPRPLVGPRELAAVLPDADFRILAGVGHVPWAEHPELLRAELRRFFS